MTGKVYQFGLGKNIYPSRFSFHPLGVFKDLNELAEKIVASKNLNRNNYIVDGEMKERLRQERDLSSITQKWISILVPRTVN